MDYPQLASTINIAIFLRFEHYYFMFVKYHIGTFPNENNVPPFLNFTSRNYVSGKISLVKRQTKVSFIGRLNYWKIAVHTWLEAKLFSRSAILFTAAQILNSSEGGETVHPPLVSQMKLLIDIVKLGTDAVLAGFN